MRKSLFAASEKFWFCTFFLVVSLFISAEPTFAQTNARGMTVSMSITPSDISDLGSWGANIARYPLHWRGFADNADATAYEAWLESSLQYFDSLLPSFEAAGIKVVLNLFTPPGGAHKSSTCTSSSRMFCEAWAQQLFLSSWEKMAQRYAGNSTIYGFDLINEPGYRQSAPGLLNWSQLAEEAGKRIRAIDPTRTIIVGIPFGDISRLKLVDKIPLDNVVYNVHFYHPWNFQHQGLFGSKRKISYPTKKLNKKTIAKRMNAIRAFQKRVGAPIYIGEFSVVRWAPKRSAYNYLKDVISLFEKNKWNWTYHSFREAHPWSVEHDGNMKNLAWTRRPTDRAKLLRSYFKKNP